MFAAQQDITIDWAWVELVPFQTIYMRATSRNLVGYKLQPVELTISLTLLMVHILCAQSVNVWSFAVKNDVHASSSMKRLCSIFIHS